MTDVELAQITALEKCTFSPGSSAKSFVRRLAGYAGVDADEVTAINARVGEATRKFTNARELSDKERDFLDKLAHQYRKQIGKCMSVACVKCAAPIGATCEDIKVALDAVIEGRAEYADEIAAWRKLALTVYNSRHGKTHAHLYEYATKVAPDRRRAETRGDIYCRLCGERLFAGVKRPHQLMKEGKALEAQRHLAICALQVLAGMREPVKPGYRAMPMESVWSSEPVALPSADNGPLFGGGRQ